MPSTLNFGPVTVNPGTRTFGPASVADTDTQVTLTVDRTVTGGLNSLTAASVLSMEAQVSNDGGVTWHAVDAGQPGSKTAWSTVGGTVTLKSGVATASSGFWPVFPGTGRRIQAIVTVSGPAAIAIAGSVATQ